MSTCFVLSVQKIFPYSFCRSLSFSLSLSLSTSLFLSLPLSLTLCLILCLTVCPSVSLSLSFSVSRSLCDSLPLPSPPLSLSLPLPLSALPLSTLALSLSVSIALSFFLFLCVWCFHVLFCVWEGLWVLCESCLLPSLRGLVLTLSSCWPLDCFWCLALDAINWRVFGNKFFADPFICQAVLAVHLNFILSCFAFFFVKATSVALQTKPKKKNVELQNSN